MKNKKSFKFDIEYNYIVKLKNWKLFATCNKIPINCEKCNKTHAHKTILLDNGKRICWYCWIHKNTKYKAVKKPVSLVKAKKSNNVNNKYKVINEGDLLENVLGEIDSKITASSDINEIKKLANSVFDDELIEPELHDMLDDNIDNPSVKLKNIPIVKKSIGVKSDVAKKSSNSKIIKNAYGDDTSKAKVKNVIGIKFAGIKSNVVTKQNANNSIKTKVTPIGYKPQNTEVELAIVKNNNNQQVRNENLAKLDEPIVPKYFRLTEQPQNEKFTLFNTASKTKRGVCTYDKQVAYAIEMLDIHKSFLDGKVIANDGIDLRVQQNEVHAIIGENGAGKSTLMSILFGLYSPDKGIIKVNGEQVFFSSAKDASKAGLGMVHQHFQLVPTYSVLENVMLGSEIINPKFRKLGVLDLKNAQHKIQTIIDTYKLNIDLETKVNKLTVSEQQKVEILKLLYHNANILIFDEPTAVLSPDEITEFLKMVVNLKKEGKTIIIITHKFNEIKSVAERATIIRLGTFISDFDVKDKSIAQMAAEMVGHEVVEIVNNNHTYDKRVLLEIIDLVLKQKGHEAPTPINLKIHAGEVYAIAGVSGNGQSELVMAISGLEKKVDGVILLDGVDISNISIQKRNELGLAHIPESRQKHGLILDLPIYMNAVSNKINSQPFSRFGIIDDKAVREHARLLIKKFDIRGTTRGTSPARGLSGGNQQKLIVARELSHEHKLIVMMQPTRGLDLGAVKFIHEKVLEEKQKGNAILLVSYELDEILSLADTIAVMSGGSLIDVGDTKKMTRSKIGQIMAGKE